MVMSNESVIKCVIHGMVGLVRPDMPLFAQTCIADLYRTLVSHNTAILLYKVRQRLCCR